MPVGSGYVIAGDVLVNFDKVAVSLQSEADAIHSLPPFFDDSLFD